MQLRQVQVFLPHYHRQRAAVRTSPFGYGRPCSIAWLVVQAVEVLRHPRVVAVVLPHPLVAVVEVSRHWQVVAAVEVSPHQPVVLQVESPHQQVVLQVESPHQQVVLAVLLSDPVQE